MDVLKAHYNLVATAFFIFFILLAHFYANHPYNWTKNTISDLGAQDYEHKWIMQAGFLSFGLILSVGILFHGLTLRTAPVLIYGLCVAATGIFCTKPFTGMEPYSTAHAALHSFFAQFAGIAFSLGILMQLFFIRDRNQQMTHLVFFVVVIGLSATFGILKNNQGIAQRLLYLSSFIWLVFFFKTSLPKG